MENERQHKDMADRDAISYYWSDNTLSAFRFESCYTTKEEVIRKITLFVENECSIEEDEEEEDLIKDLISKVFL
mgnify:CR=1 FL=1